MQSFETLQSLAEHRLHELRTEAERERMLGAAPPAANLLAARFLSALSDRLQLARTRRVSPQTV